MTKKKMISILLVVISLLSFCSFSVSAADETFTVSAMHSSMYTETDTGSGINIKNYDFVDGTETHGGILLHWFSAVDRNFYNAGSNKVVSTYDYSNLVAGHEYELIFNTYLNIMSERVILIKVTGLIRKICRLSI